HRQGDGSREGDDQVAGERPAATPTARAARRLTPPHGRVRCPRLEPTLGETLVVRMDETLVERCTPRASCRVLAGSYALAAPAAARGTPSGRKTAKHLLELKTYVSTKSSTSTR